jgi:hypothetical protein
MPVQEARSAQKASNWAGLILELETAGEIFPTAIILGPFRALVNWETASWRDRHSGLQNLASLRTDLLILDFLGVPTPTEGFYQINRANHSLPE